MRQIIIFLILSNFLLSSFPFEEKNPSTESLASISSSENLFLNKIKEGIDSTEGIAVKMLSYEKVGTIDSDQEKERLITDILDKDSFYFFNYDTSDNTFADLKMFTFEEALKLNSESNKGFVEELEVALQSNAEFLNGTLEVGHEVFEIEWSLRGRHFNTLAIFAKQEFVYDNLLSNLITFEVKKIPAGEIWIR